MIVDGDTWVGAFYRAWKGENRINTITKIEQIVNQTVDAIDSHKNTDYIEIIINYFSYARNGVDSLSCTYQNDPDMKARINVQLKNIDLQLNQYRHLIKGYSSGDIENKKDMSTKDMSTKDRLTKKDVPLPQNNTSETNNTTDVPLHQNSSSTGSLNEAADKDRRRRRRQKDLDPLEIVME